MVSKPKDWRYLGPGNFPQWLLRLLPFSNLFDKAAKEHDILYGIGGNREKKRYADSKFAEIMLKDIIKHKSHKYNPFAYLLGFIYYLAVDIFGFMFFNWKKPKEIEPKSL